MENISTCKTKMTIGKNIDFNLKFYFINITLIPSYLYLNHCIFLIIDHKYL